MKVVTPAAKPRFYRQRGLKAVIKSLDLENVELCKAELFYNPLTDIQLTAHIFYHSFLIYIGIESRRVLFHRETR